MTQASQTNSGICDVAAVRSAAISRICELLDVKRDPSVISRAVADEEGNSKSPIASAFHRLGLSTRVAPELIGRLYPGQVVLAIHEDALLIAARRGRRIYSLTRVSFDNGELGVVKTRTSLREIKRQLRGADRSFVVSHPTGLAPLARPGGYLAPWRRLSALVSVEKRDVYVVALYAATLGVLTLVSPIATQALVNTIAFGAILQPLIVLTIALFVGLSLAGAIVALQSYVVEVLQRRILVRVAEDFAQRYAFVDTETWDKQDLVELNNRFLDVITLQKSSAELLLTGLGLALQILVGTILLGFYHPILLVFDLVLVACFIGVIVCGRGGTDSAIYESKAKFSIAAWLDEIARNPHMFASRAGRQVAADELSFRAHNYVSARSKHFRKVFTVLLGGVGLQVTSVVALLAIGGYLVIERQLTLGQLIAAEIVIGAIAAGMGKLGRLAEKTFDLVAATDKIGKVLDLPLTERGDNSPVAEEGAVQLTGKNLSVGYGGEVMVENLSFELAPGQRAMVVGAPGSGRSAVLESIAGRRQAASGTIDWHRGSNPAAAQSGCAMLVRDDEFIAATIYTNLRLGNAELSTSDAWQALDDVGLREIISRLPHGLDTMMKPSGAPLSRSGLKRLALARAIIARPGLILIDEALDHINDEDLVKRFLGPEAPWTALVATRDQYVANYTTHKVAVGGEA